MKEPVLSDDIFKIDNSSFKITVGDLVEQIVDLAEEEICTKHGIPRQTLKGAIKEE